MRATFRLPQGRVKGGLGTGGRLYTTSAGPGYTSSFARED